MLSPNREPQSEAQHYALEAIKILQNIVEGLAWNDGNQMEDAMHQPVLTNSADLRYIIATLCEMTAEHSSLVHHLEMASLSRVKYYENAPNLVTMFRRKMQDTITACRIHALQKLEHAITSAKEVSKELISLKTYRKTLQEDNERLKVLVEEVSRKTEKIMNTVLEYYNRRSQNKDAIASALESVTATQDRVSIVEKVIDLELEEWEGDEYLLRMKDYELGLILCLEQDDVIMEEEIASTYDEEDATLRRTITKLAKELENLKHSYHTDMIVIRAQNKIKEAVIGKTLAERLERIADLGRCALRMESPSIYPESDEDISLLEEEEETSRLDMSFEGEELDKPKGPDLATAADLELLFRPVTDTGQQSGFNKDEWEGILGSFDTVDQLQAKIRTLVSKEKHLNEETQKLKRQLAARTRKLDKLKKDVIDLNDETTRLQQGCDELFNALRDLEEQDGNARERSTKELRALQATTVKEQDLTKTLKEELKQLEYQLNDYTLISSMEMKDLKDAILDQHDSEDEIKLNIAIEFERHLLMLLEIEYGCQERDRQEFLRSMIAQDYGYFVHQLHLFEVQFQLLTDILDQEDSTFDSLYLFYTAKSRTMATMCTNINNALDGARTLVEMWKVAVEETMRLSADVRTHCNSSASSAHTFSLQLEGDLVELNHSFVAYKILSRICQNYIPYVKEQTKTPLAATERLLQAIRKLVDNRPRIVEEVDMKKKIGQKITDRLLTSGSTAGNEYNHGAVFLRSVLTDLEGLQLVSSGSGQLLELSNSQSGKIVDIGSRFVSHLLRKQTSLDMAVTFGLGPAGDGLLIDHVNEYSTDNVVLS